MSEVGDFDPFIRPRVGEIAAAREEAARRGGEDIGFGDFIDLINPLHHLPVIGPLYREITGDEIKPAAQILGGFLYGGPVGLVTSASQAIAEEATGKDVTGHVMAALFGEDDTATDAPGTATIAAAPASEDALLPELAPAAGAAPAQETLAQETLAPETLAPETLAPETPGTETAAAPAAAAPEQSAVLEGDAALRAFLRDREAALEPARPTASQAGEATAPEAGAGNSNGAGSEAPPLEAAPAMTPQRFMPVRSEHYSGRMAVRGPAGFAGESSSGAASAITGESGAESPFAARMMEALKKYSALQDTPQTSAATLP